jgi:hypothetical protein
LFIGSNEFQAPVSDPVSPPVSVWSAAPPVSPPVSFSLPHPVRAETAKMVNVNSTSFIFSPSLLYRRMVLYSPFIFLLTIF